jgi:hypothetical protein
MKITLLELRRVVHSVLSEAVCPDCGSKDAYIGLHDIECNNPKCKFFSEKQAQMAGTGPGVKKRRTISGEDVFPICNRDMVSRNYLDRVHLHQRFPKLHKSISDSIGRFYDDDYDDERIWFVANGKPFSVQDDYVGDEYISSWNDNGDSEEIAIWHADPSENTFVGDPQEGDPGFSYDKHLWYIPVDGKENHPAIKDLLSLSNK